jgi:hypothetical protein
VVVYRLTGVKMRVLVALSSILSLVSWTTGTIMQNGQARITNFPNTKVELAAGSYKTYNADAEEISYKGRWDSKKISWWA